LEEAVEAGKIKSIGLSNFSEDQLREVLAIAKIAPVVNQVECHPYQQRKELKRFMDSCGIALEAWYPIGHGAKDLLSEDVFVRLAEKYNKSVVQIILRWHVQENNIVIPKSTNPEHIRSNFDIFDFELSESEMKDIGKLDRQKSYFKVPAFVQKIVFKLFKFNFDK